MTSLAGMTRGERVMHYGGWVQVDGNPDVFPPYTGVLLRTTPFVAVVIDTTACLVDFEVPLEDVTPLDVPHAWSPNGGMLEK